MSFKVRDILFKNTGIQVISQGMSLCLSLATVAVLSRYLGVEGYGEFNYIFAFFYFFLVLNDFGVDTTVVREISKRPAESKQILGSMLSYKLLVSVTLAAIAWISIFFMKFPEPTRSSLLIFAFILPLQALQTPALIFQSNLKMEYPALIGLGNKIFQFLLLMSATALDLHLQGVVAALMLSELSSLMAVTVLSRRFVKPRLRFDLDLWKQTLKSSIPIGMASLFAAVINRIDFLMLERMTSMQEVGLYAATYKIANTFETLPLLMMATLYPMMARFATEDPLRLRSVYAKGNLLFAAIAIPGGVVISWMSPFIIKLLFGARFEEAAEGLRILIWASVFVYLALQAGNLLIILGREKINVVINAAAALMNIGLNFWLIPQNGFIGASIATVASYGFILIATRVSARIVLAQTIKT